MQLLRKHGDANQLPSGTLTHSVLLQLQMNILQQQQQQQLQLKDS